LLKALGAAGNSGFLLGEIYMQIPKDFKFVPKHRAIMTERIINGVWYGGWQADIPVVILNGVPMDARLVAQHLNMVLNSETDKYYRKTHYADLEQSIHTGDSEDPGDGTGQSQE